MNLCIKDILKSFLFRLILLGIYSLGFYYGLYSDSISKQCEYYYFVCIIIDLLKVSWIATLPYLFLTHLGIFLYVPIIESQYKTIQTYSKVFNDRLYFRFVTRGTNNHTIRTNANEALNQCIKSLSNKINWTIEIVTDKELNLKFQNKNIKQIVVPSDYIPPNNVKFKGRALHYAVSASDANNNDWIIHLDEETRFNHKTILGILEHIRNNNDDYKIGQGVILYAPERIFTKFDSLKNISLTIQHWITTLADSIRVVDDYGRFRLQFEAQTSWFGIKGSFIVCKNLVEKQIGFDYGDDASITEDTFFALNAVEYKVKYAFINATMYESSPFTLFDFMKQRRRWIAGLWKVLKSPQLKLKTKLPLMFMVLFWSVSFVSWLVLIVIFIFRTSTNNIYSSFLGFIFVLTCSLYILGFLLSEPKKWIKTHGIIHWLLSFGLQIIGMPVFSFLEGISIVYWLVSPEQKKFEIVQKENDQVINDSIHIEETNKELSKCDIENNQKINYHLSSMIITPSTNLMIDNSCSKDKELNEIQDKKLEKTTKKIMLVNTLSLAKMKTHSSSQSKSQESLPKTPETPQLSTPSEIII
jgi:egghead protein (zeste-white 4 protein)